MYCSKNENNRPDRCRNQPTESILWWIFVPKIDFHTAVQNFFLCRRHCDTIKYIMVGYPIFGLRSCLSTVLSLPIPQWLWTIAEMSASVWTSSTSVQTFGAIIHPNSEFWQRIGQPYAHKSGRCFVAVVDIEVDSLSSCSNRGGRSPTKGNGGKTVRWRRAGNKQSPDNAASQTKLFHVKHSY